MRKETVKALVTGNAIDLANPDNYEFNIHEIATLLAKIKRFNGASDVSVLTHSLFVANKVYELTGNPFLTIRALLHDSQEAFVGDIGTPVKRAMGEHWDIMEARIFDAIRKQLIPRDWEMEQHATQLTSVIDTYYLAIELDYHIEAGIFADNEIWKGLRSVPLEPSDKATFIEDVKVHTGYISTFRLLYDLRETDCREHSKEDFELVKWQSKWGGLDLMIRKDKVATFEDFFSGR